MKIQLPRVHNVVGFQTKWWQHKRRINTEEKAKVVTAVCGLWDIIYSIPWYFGCTYKTSQDKTSQDKMSQDKTSQGQNIPGTKRPRDKTFQGQNVPGTKRHKGQNIPGTNRPKGQNVLRDKTSQGNKWGPLSNMCGQLPNVKKWPSLTSP